jgi:hypothetical protein
MLAINNKLNQNQGCTLLDTANSLVYQCFHKHTTKTELSCYIKELYKSTHGYIYLVHAVGTNRYKIGKTGTLTRRIKELRSQSPYPIDVIYYHWSPDPSIEEEILHSYFRQARVHGEWFAFHELTEKERQIMPSWETASSGSMASITRAMREKYRWSREHAIEVIGITHSGKMRVSAKIEPILIKLLQSKIEGGEFVLQNQKTLGKDYDLFFCSILNLTRRSILTCESVNKLSFACAFLEAEMISIINKLLEESILQDSKLKVKEAINTGLSSFLIQMEKIEVVSW